MTKYWQMIVYDKGIAFRPAFYATGLGHPRFISLVRRVLKKIYNTSGTFIYWFDLEDK
jgi:hypothetical protein